MPQFLGMFQGQSFCPTLTGFCLSYEHFSTDGLPIKEGLKILGKCPVLVHSVCVSICVLGDGAEGGGVCSNVQPAFANLHLSRCRYGLIQKTRTRRRRVCLACASRDGAPSHQSFSHRRPIYVLNNVLWSVLCNKYHEFICILAPEEWILYVPFTINEDQTFTFRTLAITRICF